jgi:hypothetical protein
MAKRTTSKTTTADLVPVEPETDLAFVQEAGAAVVAFLKRATDFFKRADALEKTAGDVLALAKTLKQPTTGDEDVELQKFIKRVAVGQQTVTGHWDGSDREPGITRLLYRLHRRATQKRDVAIVSLKGAADIGNRLHTGYTTKAREDAERERQRLQAIEDAKAQQQRADELAELERQALAREADSDALSDREQVFVDEYVAKQNGAQAAARAGYKDPSAQALRLLKSAKVLAAIKSKQEAIALREQAAAVAAAPVEAVQVQVEADIAKAPGAKDVTRWKAKVVDEAAFIAAVFEGKLGIPRDVLCIDVVKLNQYARDLHQVMNRWPGVKAVDDTKVQ